MARLSIMDRLLIALGPPFSEKLPKAPTNDTLATVPTPINITAEPCPYKYKVRCCVFFSVKRGNIIFLTRSFYATSSFFSVI